MLSHPQSPVFRPLCRPEIADLPPYNAGLAADAVKECYGLDSVIKLGSNENPYGPPPQVHDALLSLFDRIALYPEAEDGLCKRLASFLDEDPGALVLGNGSEQLIRMIMQGFVSPADRIVTVLPSFGLHILNAVAMGGTVTAVPVTAESRFDLDALCQAVSTPTRILIFSNPSNPVGCMMTGSDLERLIAACPPDCLIVIDEAYREYGRCDPAYPDARTILRRQTRPWIVLGTFSKAWGLAGLRIGYAICSEAGIVRALDTVRDPFNTNIAAQLAARAALDGQDHMTASVAATVVSREALRQEIGSLGIDVAPSWGNFLFLALPFSSDTLAESFLRRGVIIKPWKEAGYTDRIRVSIGLEADNARFLSALRAVLEESHTSQETHVS